MKRRAVPRRTAVVGLALATVTSLALAGTAGAAVAEPAGADRPTGPRAADAAPGVGAQSVVPGRYLVVLKPGASARGGIRAAATELSRRTGGTVRRVFTSALTGYSAQLSAAQASRLAADPAVASVEPVRRYAASDVQLDPPSWGLDRIDQTTPSLDHSYSYPAGSGAGVTAYVIDSGINISHQDFGGRASYGYDFVDNDAVADDCAGHGTHVAGTLGGTSYGVAKEVKLVAVRVLGCDDLGTTEGVVAGIDWVTANAVRPAVANLSLGGAFDPVLNSAVAASIAAGISYAVAAGNARANACDYSPSSVPAAITVGATDQIDIRASFSNTGSCVDTFAPGLGITSASIGSDTASAVRNGTSMASPHVAGAAALVLAEHPAWTPEQVRDSVVTTGIAGAVVDPYESPDRLLHVGPAVLARGSVGLRARINDNYVFGGAGEPLLATSYLVDDVRGRFDVVPAGNDLVALRAKANGQYVTAESAGNKPLIPRATVIGAWEKFELVDNADGSVSLKAQANGRYVTAESAGSKSLIARGLAIGPWERFDLDSPYPIVSLRAKANGKFVTAESAGARPLIARGDAVGAWEKFELIDRRHQGVALRALVNDRYVSGDIAGAAPLVASGTWIGPTEGFWLDHHNPDGTVVFGSEASGMAVTAESGGARPLIANRPFDPTSPTGGTGLWEAFALGLA